uniref:HEAT repeat-containing protein 6 n=1 Tax=Anopheles farauti TaxID=69004 RepID=A0A182Q6Z2_9DIPT
MEGKQKIKTNSVNLLPQRRCLIIHFHHMELEQRFLQLSTKFLFLNCGSQIADYRNEINTLLNELNGLNYRSGRIGDVRSPVRLVESFVNIPPHEDTLVVKSCFLIKSLVGRQKIILPEAVTHGLIAWLRKCLERRFYQVACEVLGTMQLLLRRCSDIAQFYEFFISNNGILVNVLADPNYRRVERRSTTADQLDHCSSSELYLAALQCLESILVASEPSGSEPLEPHLELVGNAVLDLAFKARPDAYTELAYYGLATSAVNCLRIVVALDESGEWTTAQLGRLIGVAKAFMMYGIPDVAKLVPQRIPVSQQGIPEPQHIPISKGGKTAKSRKTRARAKNKRGSSRNSGAGGAGERQSGVESDIGIRQPYSEASIVLEWSSKCQPAPGGNYQTSDSDYSETEATSSREQLERHRSAKLRHAALVLIGTLAQHVEKRIMFGYWHALFPDETRTPATVSLLNCVLRDPSPKCRIAAVQAASFLLHKSKPFLIQAESSKKPLVSFTPFSVTLGNMVIEMYDMLTQAVAAECDLTVLTQLLKGLTVCVQATPFHRLQAGIATRFVRIVRPLVRYRDPTIKVAALMVMGFLISVTDMTEEIAALVGIKRLALAPTGNEARSKPVKKAFDLEVNREEQEEEEQAQDSDAEEEAPRAESQQEDASYAATNEACAGNLSWLLQVVLENLGVNGPVSAVMPVRMECLQVLCAMTAHYSLLADHLSLVAQALMNAFGDAQFEIKLYAGRLLDLLGHAIHTSLLLKDKIDADELTVALHFWTEVIPTVREQIQDVQLAPSLRSVCCDALGNIGRDRQLALISLLTGCTFDDDSSVSSAAARSLSVYILFPSLRDDVCYVENTIESILRILQDPNLAARIKTSWSLGNATDALILNQQHHHQQQHADASSPDGSSSVSDELMRRVLEAALESSKDNDKVRSNAVRTIGNVLHMLRPAQLEQPAWSSLCHDAIERLIQNVTVSSTVNVKVKWNACYALGNMMKNETCFLPASGGSGGGNWERRVFPALCETVINSPNFKVRINAAQALSVIGRRAHYGPFFLPTWTALLQALDQSDNLVDYNEYKRRDALQEQLCLSLAHLLRQAMREDVVSMATALLPLYDTIRCNWVRVLNRILPEKSASLLESYRVLLELRKSKPEVDGGSSISSWDVLLNCFKDSDVC